MQHECKKYRQVYVKYTINVKKLVHRTMRENKFEKQPTLGSQCYLEEHCSPECRRKREGSSNEEFLETLARRVYYPQARSALKKNRPNLLASQSLASSEILSRISLVRWLARDPRIIIGRSGRFNRALDAARSIRFDSISGAERGRQRLPSR